MRPQLNSGTLGSRERHIKPDMTSQSMIIIAAVAVLGTIAWLTFGRRDPSLENPDRSHAPLSGRSGSATTATPNLLQAPSMPPSTTTMNPKNLLFSLPTLCDRIPPVESIARDSIPTGSTVIDEDDWRQVEFAAVRDRAIVDRELAQLAQFKVEKRAGAGWTDVFIRQSRPDAIAPLAIPLADLLRSANAGPLPLYLRSGGVVSQVRGGFAVPLHGIVLYGHTDGNNLVTLAVEKRTAEPLDAEQSRAVAHVCHAFNLLVVDWYRVAVIAP